MDVYDAEFRCFMSHLLKSNCIKSYYSRSDFEKLYPNMNIIGYLEESDIFKKFFECVSFLPLISNIAGMTLTSLTVFININFIQMLDYSIDDELKAVIIIYIV